MDLYYKPYGNLEFAHRDPKMDFLAQAASGSVNVEMDARRFRDMIHFPGLYNSIPYESFTSIALKIHDVWHTSPLSNLNDTGIIAASSNNDSASVAA